VGGVEITDWQLVDGELCVEGQWAWPCSLELEVRLPDADEGQAMQLHVAASVSGRQDSELQVPYRR